MTGFIVFLLVDVKIEGRRRTSLRVSERLLWGNKLVAEGVGTALTSAPADPVFKTGAASFYLPAFRKVALAKGLSPLSPSLEATRSIY